MTRRSYLDYEYFESDLERAHQHSSHHRAELMRSVCGCFHCLETFEFDLIRQWTDNNNTALCPFCSIDAVIGSASGYPIDANFLGVMQTRWFGNAKE